MSRKTASRLAQLEEWLQDPTCRRALVALAQSYADPPQNLGCKDDQFIAEVQYGSWLVRFTPARMVLNRSGHISVYERDRAEGVEGAREANGNTHIALWEWIGTGLPRQSLYAELPDGEADCFISDVFDWLTTGGVPQRIRCWINRKNEVRSKIPERGSKDELD